MMKRPYSARLIVLTAASGGGSLRFTPFALFIASVVAFQLGILTTYFHQASYNSTLAQPWDSSNKDEDSVTDHSTFAEAVKLSSTNHSSSFALAKRESLGFFNDISEQEWKLLKQKVTDVYPNTIDRLEPSQVRNRAITANRFFQDYFEPDFACRHERRIGRLGDGGKWVCDPHRLQASTSMPPPPCLVYSIGSNGDASFEQAIKTDIGQHCEIHTFDMKNYTAAVQVTGAIFHQWGLAVEAKVTRRGEVYKTLKDTVRELGHVGRTIDIFKIDCEGCEWTTFQSFFDSGVEMRQVLIELHSDPPPKDDPKSNRRFMPFPHTMDFFENMMRHHYVIFHKEVNIRFWHFGQCIEYAFLKLAPAFFDNIPALQNSNSSVGVKEGVRES